MLGLLSLVCNNYSITLYLFITYIDAVTPRPITGLYFLLNNAVILPGDSILITDIGRLACVTTNVNTRCCNDGTNSSEWLFPNGTVVPRDYSHLTSFFTTGSSGHINLYRGYRAISNPLGVYTCRVHSENSSVIHSANVTILLRGEPYTTAIAIPTLKFPFHSRCHAP